MVPQRQRQAWQAGNGPKNGLGSQQGNGTKGKSRLQYRIGQNARQEQVVYRTTTYSNQEQTQEEARWGQTQRLQRKCSRSTRASKKQRALYQFRLRQRKQDQVSSCTTRRCQASRQRSASVEQGLRYYNIQCSTIQKRLVARASSQIRLARNGRTSS